ncbi:reverse transcriptase N-terminal domain-containing protein [Streptomyces sp. NPDC058220]|uniref:reverse transcriptase N-terminal domain-containing protein n=1 Tax=unclassified Streptomyces TaxID=2593676 RepID=UPI0036F1612C
MPADSLHCGGHVVPLTFGGGGGESGSLLRSGATAWSRCTRSPRRAAEENVRRLRQRIFAASQAGDLKRVRNLQMTCSSRSGATCMSMRRKNAGTSRPVWEQRVSCSTSPESTFGAANRSRVPFLL